MNKPPLGRRLKECLRITGICVMLFGCAWQGGGTAGEKAVTEYGELPAGKRDVVGRDDRPIDRETISEKLAAREWVRYTMCDIAGDALEELHIRVGTQYYVIAYRDGGLHLLYEGVYEVPVRGNGLCGIFYHRPGGAPTHDTYGYKRIDGEGTITEELWFEWYDANENGERDDEDLYIYGEQEIKRTQWEEKTRHFLEIDEDAIKWQDVSKPVTDQQTGSP